MSVPKGQKVSVAFNLLHLFDCAAPSTGRGIVLVPLTCVSVNVTTLPLADSAGIFSRRTEEVSLGRKS